MTASVFAKPETRPVFRTRTVRARWVSAFGSLGGHVLLLLVLISGAAGILASPAPRTPTPAHAASTALPVAEAPYIEMVEIARPQRLPGAPPGLDPKLYRELLRHGVKDFENLTPEAAMRKLKGLTDQAANISDASLADIGRFLGMDPDRYKVRTYYRDTLNPNLNFHHARVVRAFAFKTVAGDAGYTITLQDKEKDTFTFALQGKPAQALDAAGLLFAGRPLTANRGPEAFELKDARIKEVQRWKREGDRVGLRGSVLVFADARGHERRLHIAGRRGDPWIRAQYSFARNFQGKLLHDPEDETTLYTDLIDMKTATLWGVTEAPSRTLGVKRARIVLLDARGNRFIYFREGAAAEEMLARARVLNENPTAQRIYRKTGLSGFLLDFINSQPTAPARTQPRRQPPADKRKDP